MQVYVHHSMDMEVRGHLVEVGSLLLPCGSWDGTAIAYLSNKYLYSLSYLTGPNF